MDNLLVGEVAVAVLDGVPAQDGAVQHILRDIRQLGVLSQGSQPSGVSGDHFIVSFGPALEMN